MFTQTSFYMKQLIVIVLLCHGVCLTANAQDIIKTQPSFYNALQGKNTMVLPSVLRTNTAAFKSHFETGTIIPGFSSKKAISVFVGTQGIGADFRYGFIPRLSARVGGAITPVDMPNAFKINDFKSRVDLNVNFTNVHLIADFQPFGGSGFRLAFGAGYFIKAKTKADITPTEANRFGDIVYDPETLGTLQMTADWKGIAPYLGIGFLRAFPSRIFNVNIDLGTYYLTAPQTTIVGTKALTPNEENNAQLQKNISGYRWLPVLQFNFNLRL